MTINRNKHLLIIGNNESLSDSLQPYQVTCINEKTQLLTTLDTQSIDLVLINDIESVELLQTMQQADMTPAVIFILPNWDTDIIQQLLTYPNIDYCIIPIQTIELQHKINTQLTLSELQQQIIKTEKLASLGGLVGGIAHEVNTPVGIGITIASHLMEDTKNLKHLFDEKKIKKSHMTDYIGSAMESSELILNNLYRASHLVESFKTISADQISEERRLFSLPGYIDDILLSLKPTLKRSPHEIIIECAKPFDIDSYPGPFSQVITNLLMNALVHAFDNEQTGTIKIAIKQQQDDVKLEFSDDGNGISETNLHHIFEAFFTTKRDQGGTGLGLNIVYNVMHKTLKGDIYCESTIDKGTTFYLTFPLQTPS